jgi:endonuclease YncB( thermonuclease family)
MMIISPLYAQTKPFIPRLSSGKVVKVYDGDTLTIAAWMRNNGDAVDELYRFNVRLRGIDTPEMKTKNAAEKQLATAARDALAQMVFEKNVRLENIATDKYGRLLCDVFVDDDDNEDGNGVHVNAAMLANHHAVAYDGGKKKQAWATTTTTTMDEDL